MNTRVLACLALMLAAPIVRAQQVTGTVTGSVLDSSGAAVAGVSVRLGNVENGLARTVTTAEDGNFRFFVLPPGIYRLDASHAGFKAVRRDGIVVEADRSLAVPVRLEVGAVTEVIEVTGGAPLLEPNTSSLGTVMDLRKVQELPLNGRNPLGLANLIPTVRGIGFFGGQVLSSWRLAAISIGGGPPLANGFLVDGIASEKLTVAGTQTFLSIDSTQEFKVLTNAMSAEFGRTAGGIVSIVSKSGTNELHGNLFEFLRNDNLNANDFFSNRAGRKLGALAYNQFGGSVGGPIKKDKLFFFANYEAFFERRASQATITSPTLLERTGDYSDTRTANGALIAVYDPTTTRSNGGGFVRDQFPNNRIPANRIDPVSTAVLKFYPEPNLPGAANTRAQNLFLQGPGPIDRHQITGKVDWNISAARRIGGRYTWDDLDWGFARLWQTPAEPDGRKVLIPRNSASLNYNDTLTPTLLLEARTGFNRENEHFFTPSEGFDIASLGMPAAFKQQSYVGRGADTGRFPQINVADAALFGAIASRGGPSHTTLSSAALTKISGAHTMKTGYEHRFYAVNDYGREFSVGNYTFNRGFTQGPNPLQAGANAGYGTASFLLGTPASAFARLQTDGTASIKYHAAFFQDDWKVTRSLTLNLGLRWEFESPPTDRYNVLSSFDPSAASPLRAPGYSNLRGGLVFPSAGGLSRYQREPNYNDFGPRFGFAWQARPKTVVRGGYGIMFIPVTVSLARTGFTQDTPMVTSLDGGLTPRDRLSNPFPSGLTRPTGASQGLLTGVGTAVAGQLRNADRGYTQQWNFTLQHQPWNNWLFEAAWVGNHGVRLFADGRNLNFLSDADFAQGTALAQTIPNPFQGVITAAGALSGATITRAQSLLPFPQFTGVNGGYSFLNNSIYHALAVKIEKRFSQGFSFLLAYTAAKLIDDGANAGQVRPGAAVTTTVQNWNNLRAERGKSSQDVPQRIVISALWELPFAKTGPAAYRHIAGGWQLNAIQTIESGTPLSLSAAVTGGGNRPNVVAGQQARLDSPTIDRWFNTGAFSNPAGYTWGNVSRTLPDVHTDSLYNMDLSLFKNFTVREGMRIQVRAEAFNVSNTPTFGEPGRAINAATFGVVTATSFNPKPREVQLALRLTF